jgi:hypothetical protein
MTPRVKICCIRSAEEARIAIDLGAAAIGLSAGIGTFLLTSRTDPA